MVSGWVEGARPPTMYAKTNFLQEVRILGHVSMLPFRANMYAHLMSQSRSLDRGGGAKQEIVSIRSFVLSFPSFWACGFIFSFACGMPMIRGIHAKRVTRYRSEFLRASVPKVVLIPSGWCSFHRDCDRWCAFHWDGAHSVVMMCFPSGLFDFSIKTRLESSL